MDALEQILAVLPGESDKDRLVVALRLEQDGSGVTLRHESYGEGIGWFTQSRLDLLPDQIGQLRNLLGKAGGRTRPASWFGPNAHDSGEDAATIPFPALHSA